MNKYVIPIAALIIIAVGGMAVSGELPLNLTDNNTTITNQTVDNNSNSVDNTTKTDNTTVIDSHNDTNSQSSDSSSSQNMADIAKDPTATQQYLDKEGKTSDEVDINGQKTFMVSAPKTQTTTPGKTVVGN